MSQKTYDRQTAKFLAVVGENMPELSGVEMQRWIENPKCLQEALCGVFCFPVVSTPWRLLTLGLHKTADLYREALTQAGFRISDWALHILGKPQFTVATEETEVELVVATVGDLGFPKGATREQIYTQAQQLGLKLCPPEVGPALRLQYPDQPQGERLLIAIEPISDSGGSPNVFCVGRVGGDRWLLRARWGSPRLATTGTLTTVGCFSASSPFGPSPRCTSYFGAFFICGLSYH